MLHVTLCTAFNWSTVPGVVQCLSAKNTLKRMQSNEQQRPSRKREKRLPIPMGK